MTKPFSVRLRGRNLTEAQKRKLLENRIKSLNQQIQKMQSRLVDYKQQLAVRIKRQEKTLKHKILEALD